MALEQFTLVLQRIQEITPTLRHLEFQREDGKPLAFTPGQFMTLLLPNAEGVIKRRSYSLSNAPDAPNGLLSLAISYIQGGIASETLFHLKIGETLKAMGPAGRLVLQEESVQRYFLVGTGTGIAPYRAMLPALHQRFLADPTLQVHLILGAQYRADLLYAEDFLAFAAQHPQFHFHAALSRDTSTLQSYEKSGYVQSYFEPLSLTPAGDIVYLCGNPNMIDDAFAWLTERGFASAQVRREKYISSN